MFVYTLVLSNSSDFIAELNKFYTCLYSAEVNANDAKFLAWQIKSSILQYNKHVLLNSTNCFFVNHIFEGNGYIVTLNIGNKNKGFFARLLDLFRG